MSGPPGAHHNLASTNVTPDDLAKVARCVSLLKQAKLHRELCRELEEDDADFQECLRLLADGFFSEVEWAGDISNSMDPVDHHQSHPHWQQHRHPLKSPVRTKSTLPSTVYAASTSSVPNPLISDAHPHKDAVLHQQPPPATSTRARAPAEPCQRARGDIRNFLSPSQPHNHVRSRSPDVVRPADHGHYSNNAAAVTAADRNETDADAAELLLSMQHSMQPGDDDHSHSHPSDEYNEPGPNSLFIKNWVSQGSHFDRAVLSFPQLYPDGDICIEIPKIEGREKVQPRIGWSKITNNQRSKCNGVRICPHYVDGCFFRERQRNPRRGAEKTDRIRESVKVCPIHDTPASVYIRCNCYWTFDGASKPDVWILNHHGSHDHPAPQTAGASHQALSEVERIIQQNPTITATELAAGRTGNFPRQPLSQIDPRFHHRDYIAYIKRTLIQAFNKKTTGSKIGPESLDGSFFYFSSFNKSDTKAYVVEAQLAPDQFIVIASDVMLQLLAEAPNPFQTDTIEGFVESIYFKGEMNVTMSSTWCPIRQTQVPVLITILMDKTKESYKFHWTYFFQTFGMNCRTIQEFLDKFPGNTSDFSDGVRAGFNLALDEYCMAKYGCVLTIEQKSLIYRFCEVHFKRNVSRSSNISKAVDPENKAYFKKEVLSLLNIVTFDDFAKQVRKLIAEFPYLASWFLWYLQNDRCTILFPACKNVSASAMSKFNRLKRDTNAQEGLGGFLQSLSKYRSLGLYHCLNTIFYWISLLDEEKKWRIEGIETKWKKASKKDKKAGRERPGQYKAPDSWRRLLSSGPKAKATKETPHATVMNNKRKPAVFDITCSSPEGPMPLKNVDQCCYANALVQNILASPPLMECLRMDVVASTGSYPFSLLRDIALRLDHMRRQNMRSSGAQEPTELLEVIKLFSQAHLTDRNINLVQRDPMELFEWIMNQLRDSGNNLGHPILGDGCIMGRLVSVKWCGACQDGWGDELQDTENQQFVKKDVDETLQKYHISVVHPSASCTLSECLDLFFAEKPSGIDFQTDTYYHECRNVLPTEQTRLLPVDGGGERVLIIQLCPQRRLLHAELSSIPVDDFQRSILSNSEIARPKIDLDLTNYVDSPHDVFQREESENITGILTGYISRRESWSSDGVSIGGHFVSVTVCPESGDYFLTDDLNVAGPVNIGIIPNKSWPSPYILFYRVMNQSQLRAFYTTKKQSGKPEDSKDNAMDAAQAGKKRRKEVFNLPFLPALSTSDVKEADLLRNTKKAPKGKKMTDIWVHITQIQSFVGAPIFKVIRESDGEIMTQHELLEADYEVLGIAPDGKGSKASGYPISYESLARLRSKTFVGDEIVNAFSSIFNKREVSKREKDSMYKCGHMFSSYFLDKLCFESGREVYHLDSVLNWTNKTRVSCRHDSARIARARPEKGAMDVFQCSRLIFPLNEDNIHWVVFVIDPTTLNQQFYDSMHGGLDENSRTHVSMCIHKWILNEHMRRHSKPHPLSKRKWTADIVESNASKLGTSSQGNTVDCALHACVVPILLQDGKALGVLGNNNSHRVAAGIEMRRRMVLSLARNEFMFETDSDTQNRDKDDFGETHSKSVACNTDTPTESVSTGIKSLIDDAKLVCSQNKGKKRGEIK